jgi:hypothetical protein
MPLMRKFRAVAGIAVVWGIGGMILGATLALVVLRLRNPGWLSPGEIVWMVARRDGITLALAGAAFAISLGVWSKLSLPRPSAPSSSRRGRRDGPGVPSSGAGTPRASRRAR